MEHSDDCDNLLSLWDSCEKWTITEFPPIESSENHIVQYDNKQGDIYKMKNCFGNPENSTHVERWKLINKVLNESNIKNVSDLENVIKKYNTYNFPFETLNKFFDQILDSEESKSFFKNDLPKIIQLALELPLLIPGEIVILKHNTNITVTYTQQQVSSILANAFLCTFRPREPGQSNYFPSINFYTLYTTTKTIKHFKVITEKLKCIINYFKRVTQQAPLGKVTYSRRYFPVNQLPKWCYSTKKLSNIIIKNKGFIEQQEGMLQVDFANCKIGGGILGRGSVQEEIRFSINPELIAARLFTVQLDSTEALIICGSEQYNKFSGYSNSFCWEGNHLDQIPYDKDGRRMTTITCIDALSLKSDPKRQFSPVNIIRELNKAFVGFHNPFHDIAPPVATGNWGCGAFRGDPRLKVLIQVMAASQAGRNVAYFTFGDETLCDDISKMMKSLRQNQTTIGELWKLLCQFYQKMKSDQKCKLYDFLMDTMNKKTTSRLSMNKNSRNNWISDSSNLNNKISSEESESDSINLEKEIIEESSDSNSVKNNFKISSSSSDDSNESLGKFFRDPFKNPSQKDSQEPDIYSLNSWLKNDHLNPQYENEEKLENETKEITEIDSDIVKDTIISCKNNLNENNDAIIIEENLEEISQNCFKNTKNENIKSIPNDDSVIEEKYLVKNLEENSNSKCKKKLFKEIASGDYLLPLYIQSKESKNNSSDKKSNTSKNPFKIKEKKIDQSVTQIKMIPNDSIEKNIPLGNCSESDETNLPSVSPKPSISNPENVINYEKKDIQIESSPATNGSCEIAPQTPTNKKATTPSQRKSVKRVKKNQLGNTPKITKYFKIDKKY